MCLDLTHRRYVPLRYLMVVLLIVLQGLVVVILHHFAGDRANFAKLVRLVICLCHCDLVLRVQGHFRVTALQLGHER